MGPPRTSRAPRDRIEEIDKTVEAGRSRMPLDSYDRTFLDSVRRRLEFFRKLTPPQLSKLAEIEDIVLGPEERDTTTRELF